MRKLWTILSPVLLVAFPVVVFSYLWLADFIGVLDGFLKLMGSVLSSTVVLVGAFVWFVNKFSKEIGSLIDRIKKIGPLEARPHMLESGLDDGATVTKSAPDSVASDKGRRPIKAKSVSAGDDIEGKAKAGDAQAQNNLGMAYHKGRGVAQDDEEAVKWFHLAAKQGVPEAQYNLGVMYNSGKGVKRDDAEATEWFRRAAEQGYAPAQNNLGMAYHKGRGVAQDDEEAVKWFRRAAEQGVPEAQYNLGVMYNSGKGVPQDNAEATEWFRRAADRRHT